MFWCTNDNDSSYSKVIMLMMLKSLFILNIGDIIMIANESYSVRLVILCQKTELVIL